MADPGTEMIIDGGEEYDDLSSESEVESDQDGIEEQPTAPLPPAGQVPSEHVSGWSTPTEKPPGPAAITARAYQQEMFEESLKQNIIVTMDTGSGKTQVAVLRIREELARSEKRVWFLAPTVPLASQQHDVLRAQISGLQSRLICGSENVEAWSDQTIWDAVLHNIRVVVSTFQILFDAVGHGFVRLDSLSLIVIDEAHNCVKKNSVARLMREMYWRDRRSGLEVPHIMGLTASPLMRTNFEDLYALEETLGSICKTPNKHRKELMTKVNRPQMHTIRYPEPPDPVATGIPLSTRSMASLNRVFRELDITRDPDIMRLRAEKTERSRVKLRRIMETYSTYCRNKVKSFCNVAKAIYTELGPWTTDYYIHKVILRFLASCNTRTDDLLEDLSEETKRYLADAFLKVDAPPPPVVPKDLSAKAEALVEILGSHKQDSVGIVFVKERATVAVLTHLLSVHPLTASRYRVGSVVGSSTKPGRQRDFLDLSRREDLYSLQDFRVGKTNLLVATNVLEEGIDVPECNLVICFDEPKTPKSFIQRRGRARMSTSHLYLIIPETSSKSADAWKAFEEEMKRLYEDDMRKQKVFEELEKRENPDYPVLEDETTGARLTIDDAKRHLEHFCATLSSQKFVDSSPYYTVRTTDGKPVDPDQPSLLKATVHLPPSLVPELRRFESLQAWYSQEYAMKDAAFQAYSKLREVGLVNQNLLPVHLSDLLPEPEARDGIAIVSEQMNPWIDVSQKWQQAGGDLFRRRLTLANQAQSMSVEIDVVLPVDIPHMQPLTIHWDAFSEWTVAMDKPEPRETVDPQSDHTYTLLSMAFGHRWGWTNAEKQYPLRVVSASRDVSLDDIAAIEFDAESMQGPTFGHLVRDVSNSNHPYIYHSWLPSRPPLELVGRLHRSRPYRPESEPESAPVDIPYVVVRDWPKRAGSFRPVERAVQVPFKSGKPYPRIHPAGLVKIDRVPAVFAHVGMLIPAIAHALEVHLVASDLMNGSLESVDIGDLSLVVTAITATSACGPTDYERVEFLGDAILKFYTTINLSARFLMYPEGFLSKYKDKIISNSRLFRAAVEFGLDKYIITKKYSVQKPVYVEDLAGISPTEQMQSRRELSTKTLADVVESLIGISYIDGGLDKALACTALLLPDKGVKWQSIDVCRRALYHNAPSDMELPVTMRRVEELIGYTFRKKSLLVEALTHGSYNLPSVVACLDRLEFLGDAILDYVVVTALSDTPELKNSDMHLLKSALVNADILGFFVMEWAVEEERTDIEILTAGGEPIRDEDTTEVKNREGTQVRLKKRMVKHPLWSFLRHLSADMGVVQRATQERHEVMRGKILAALMTEDRYPWALLARLQAQKFYSDVYESVLGAVWVDSGDMEECKGFVQRSGILPLMERLLADRVHIIHPKEELGRLAGREKVEYHVEVRNEEEGEAEKEMVCRVLVGTRCLVEVKGGVTREEARTRAAEVACMVLRAESREEDEMEH